MANTIPQTMATCDDQPRIHRETRGSRGSTHKSGSDEMREVSLDSAGSTASREGPKSVKDLKFDLDQPWQRSLLRELEDIEKREEAKNARPRSHNILLGRAQSGDYLMECSDDELSVMTDTSATIPLRSQSIHRPPFITPTSNPSLFMDNEAGETATTQSSNDSKIERRVNLESTIRRSSGHSGGLELREGLHDSSSDSLKVEGVSTIVPQVGIHRANALLEDRSTTPTYLTRTLQPKPEEDPTSADAVDYAGSAACMCLGYDLLDFLLPLGGEPSKKSPRKKRRTNTGMVRPSSRMSSLGTVNEELGAHPPSMPRLSMPRLVLA